MSLAIPLGVRIYNNFGAAFDQYVTQWVEDISFRSVIPGGFASATIRLHNAAIALFGGGDAGMFNPLGDLFNRVQITDNRTMEIVWEGRIEDARKATNGDGWELGVLGAMVITTDIQRAMFYIDADINSWVANPTGFEFDYDIQTDEASQTIAVTLKDQVWAAPQSVLCMAWQKGEQVDVNIGRIDCTYKGGGNNANLARFSIWLQVADTLGAGAVTIDATTCTSALIRKGNVVPTDIVSLVAKRAYFHIGTNTGSNTVAGQNVVGRFIEPHVQVQRLNRFGSPMQLGLDYPNDWLTVSQIVEDVIGRYLAGGHFTGSSEIPYQGQVNPFRIYIDATSTAKISSLTYYDGATAAQILNDMISAQPGAYWAVWESNYGATNSASDSTYAGHRFEWATWPDSWGYQASTIDGSDLQPTGKDVYNGIFYEYTSDGAEVFGMGNFNYVQSNWDAENSIALRNGHISRTQYVRREEKVNPGNGFAESTVIMNKAGKTKNAGTLTVARPIYMFDQGADSHTGCARMLDPWQIRPGKLLRITDVPARSQSHDFTKGDSPWPGELDGTIYRVIATEFNSSTGECTLELDQVTTWDVANQITNQSNDSSNLKVKG